MKTLGPFETELFLRHLYGLANRVSIDPGSDPAGLVLAEAVRQDRRREIAAAASYGLCILKKALAEDMGESAFVFEELIDLYLDELGAADSTEKVCSVLSQAKDQVFHAVYQASCGVIVRR